MVVGGVAPREKVDYELTRCACYLIVQNGDPRTAHDAGVITNEEFAVFQNAGYMGLYGKLMLDE